MKIIIETIPHSEQRYDTCGDWYWDEEDHNLLHIKISDLRSFHPYQTIALLGVHELVEALGCINRCISQEEVDEFDLAWKGEGEPGDSPLAPYHLPHQFATFMERRMAEEFSIDWQQYEAAIKKLG